MLVHGFFHADPHPGNVFLTDEGRLALLDLGIVERVDPALRRQLLKLVLAVSDGRGREAAVIGMELGRPLPDADRQGFKREVADLVGRVRHAPVGRLQVGLALMDVARLSARHGIRPASELAVLGKTLLHLDEVGRILAPDFQPDPVVRRHADTLMRQEMLAQLSPENLFSTALEVNELVTTLPARLNGMLEAMAEDRFQLRVDAFDEPRLVRNLLRIANRITLGLVLAALIVGAALLMRVETPFTILGYPGLAMLLFLLAAGCGFALVASILIQDGRERRQP